MAYITVYYIDFDTKEVISTYDYSLEVGQTQNINVQDHIPAGYLDLFTYNNGNFVYDNSIQVVADEPLYVNGQTGDRFTNNVICFVSATWDGTSNLPIDDLSDSIDLVSIIPTHTSEIAPVDIVDSISITENAMSGQFLTIGDICYPTCSVSLFKGEYTSATVFLKGSEFYVVAQMFGVYQILGKFTITNEPVVDADTVSFEASGVLSSEGINSVVDLAEVLTEQRKTEILQVQPSLDHIVSPTDNNMSYYWYFIVEDIYELFGIPLIIDRWDYCRENFLASNNIMELLIPTKTISTSDTDEDGFIETTIENEKEITWKDIICNIALLLNCNIVEHGGVIHLKRLPTMESKAKKFYVGADIYDDNSRFSSNNYWLKSATIKYREYAIRNTYPGPYLPFSGPEDAVFWGNNTRSHTAFEGIPTTWNAGAIEYNANVNCAYFRPYFWRSTRTNKQLITLLCYTRAAKALYRSFDIDEDITWEGLNVFNGVPDVVYTPADVNFLGWNPLMSIGNCFICADYDGNNRIIYVGNQTISYSGGVTVSVSSACNLEDGTSSEYTTSEISSTATGGVANIQSIVNQMLEGVLIRDNALNGTKITDATITGGKITDATITGGKIANSTITSTQIADSTITNAKIANSTITGSKIVDGTLDGSTKIANATISYAKIDNSFVGNLVADSAFVTELQAEIATFGYITAQQADIAYMKTTFANMDTANINKTNIGTLFNEVGLITSATIQDGHITGYLDAVEVNANKITAGTLIADRLILTYTQGGVTHYRLLDHFDAQDNPVYTTLNGDTITERTIRANHIVADSITANEIATGTITADEIAAHTITADEMSITDLSTISANMGTITAGTLQSNNYVAGTSGMRLTLSNGVWDSKYFKISSTGAITSTAGTIGGWDISNNMLASSTDDAWISLNSENARINMSRIGGGGTYTMDITTAGISQFYQASSGSNDSHTVDLHYTGLNIASDYPQQFSSSSMNLDDSGLDFTYNGSSDITGSYTGNSIHLKDVTDFDEFEFNFSNGLRISNNSNLVFKADMQGNLSTGGTITATGLITAKGGVDSWGKLEGSTLKINNTGASSFNILGGGSIAGALAVGGNITSNNKNVVVDNYASNFMGFTTATVTKSVPSGTSTLTNLTYVDLTPGVYAVECTAEWGSNSTTGYRHLVLSTSSTGGPVDRFAAVTGPAGPSYDRQSFVRLFHLTSNTRFYLNAQQNSGGDISTLGGIQALRLGNN